jgi:hypothetical protein
LPGAPKRRKIDWNLPENEEAAGTYLGMMYSGFGEEAAAYLDMLREDEWRLEKP